MTANHPMSKQQLFLTIFPASAQNEWLKDCHS